MFILAAIGNMLYLLQNNNVVVSLEADNSATSGLPGISSEPEFGVAADVGWGAWGGGAASGVPGPGPSGGLGLLRPLAAITVLVAGTPQQLSLNSVNCNAIYFQPFSSNTGKIYVGRSNLNKSTLAGCLRVLLPPPATPTFLDSWNPQGRTSMGPMDLSTVYVDADNSGDGVLVSYLIA